jgi:predicted metallopeptidase
MYILGAKTQSLSKKLDNILINLNLEIFAQKQQKKIKLFNLKTHKVSQIYCLDKNTLKKINNYNNSNRNSKYHPTFNIHIINQKFKEISKL